jgi:hypothetical protein
MTEYGLRLAKRVLKQVKKVAPCKITLQEEAENIIRSGDTI